MAQRDLAGLASPGGLDSARRPAASAARDHRREARREDARGLYGGPGGGGTAGSRGHVSGRVPDRAHDARRAPGRRARRRADAAEVHTLLSEAPGRARVPSARWVSTMTLRYTGARVKRVEDPRLLRGGGRYLADLELPRALSVAFV